MSVKRTESVNCGGHDLEVTGLFSPSDDDGPSDFEVTKIALPLPDKSKIDITEMIWYLECGDILRDLAYERIDEDDGAEEYIDVAEDIDEDAELYDEMDEAEDEDEEKDEDR